MANPYLVILKGETMADAITRHRQQTGYLGPLALLYNANRPGRLSRDEA